MFLEIHIPANEELQEILIAELNQLDFDSYWQEETHLLAYIDENLFKEIDLKEVLNKYQVHSYEIKPLEDKNWNEEWEKNFDPVFISDKCVIRADFHKEIVGKYPLEIIINPKMSFGTGHHETTNMMMQHILSLQFEGTSVLDAGSGTGVLAIAAAKLGAKHIEAYDIEDWAFENLKENCNLNLCNQIKVYQGHIRNVPLTLEKYDIIFANINRNILLDEMEEYKKHLKNNGILLLSGFYIEDISVMEECLTKNGLKIAEKLDLNKWASLKVVVAQ